MDFSETEDAFNQIPSNQTQNRPLYYNILLAKHPISGGIIDDVSDEDDDKEAKETKESEYENEGTITVSLGEEESTEASQYSDMSFLGNMVEIVENESAPYTDENSEEEEKIAASRYSTLLMLDSIKEYVKIDSASDKDLNKEEENVAASRYSTALVLDSIEEIVESKSAPDEDENKHKGCLIEGDNDLVIRDTDPTERDNDLVIRDTDRTERDIDNDLVIRDTDRTERDIDNDLTESEDDLTESEGDLTESEGDLTESEDDLLEREDCLKVMTDLLKGFQYEKGLEVYILDFITSFVYDVLEDASEYSFKLAGKQEIDMDDVILAMDMLQMKSTVSPSEAKLLESKMRQRQFLQTTSTIEFTLPKIPLEPKILLQPKKRQHYCFQKSNSIEFNFPKVPKSKAIGNVHSKAQEKDKSTITEYIGPLFGEDMIPKEDAVEPMDIDDPLTSTFVDLSLSTYVFPSTSTCVFPSTKSTPVFPSSKSTPVFPSTKSTPVFSSTCTNVFPSTSTRVLQSTSTCVLPSTSTCAFSSTIMLAPTSSRVLASTSTYVAPTMSADEDQSGIEYVDLSTHRFAHFFTGRRSLDSNSSKSRTKPLLNLDKDKCPVSTSKDSEPFLTPLFPL